MNTDNRINYGPVMENLTYVYARTYEKGRTFLDERFNTNTNG